MIAYYAAPKAIHGTDVAYDDMAVLRKMGYRVINTNERKYAAFSMTEYLGLVRESDVVYVRPFPDGKIGSGNAQEIKEAQRNGIPVFEFPTCHIARMMTRNETRAKSGLPPLPEHRKEIYSFPNGFAYGGFEYDGDACEDLAW